MGKLVVFVSDVPRSREAKLAYGLQCAGWQVILLHREKLPFDAGRYGVVAYRYKDGAEAVAMARTYSPAVYHVFATWQFDIAAALIRQRPGKIVFDNYDMVAGMVKQSFATAQAAGIATEKFCLENADALCCRNIETQYAKRYMGYRYRKRLFFPEYCWNIPSPPTKLPIVDGSLGIANVGNLHVNLDMPLTNPANYHLGLAVGLAYHHKFKTFLYFIPLRWTTRLAQRLTRFLAANPLVYFRSVPYERLIYELQIQCHAGLMCLPAVDASKAEPYVQRKREYTAANKVFDYIDAGIPIIMDSDIKFLYWFVQRYHKVFDFDVFMANPRVVRDQIQDLLVNRPGELTRAREALSVRRHIWRLVRLYESI